MRRRQGELGARLYRILLLDRLLRCPGSRNLPGSSGRIFLKVRKRWRRVHEYEGPGVEKERVLDSDESSYRVGDDKEMMGRGGGRGCVV